LAKTAVARSRIAGGLSDQLMDGPYLEIQVDQWWRGVDRARCVFVFVADNTIIWAVNSSLILLGRVRHARFLSPSMQHQCVCADGR
jgi:hypothetical protein